MRFSSVVLSLVAAARLAAQGSYQITHTYTLGGAGGWDYLVPDPSTHRVYIGRSDRVMVVDEMTGTLIGEVTGINGAHGTAIVDKVGRGFATSGEDSSIVMFDLTTLKPLGKIHAAEDADAIIYDPASNRVFSFNGDAHSSTVVDPDAGKLVTNIPLGGKPEYGVSAGDGKVYVNLTDKAEIVEIDAKALTVTRRWSTTGCGNPVAMAIDKQHQRLFSGCRSGVMAVSDYRGGKVVATAPIGAGVDGVGFDPASGDVFAAGADGTLTVIHEDTPNSYRVMQTLETMRGSRNMGLDPSTHAIFLSGAKFEPQAPGARGRPKIIPGSYVLLQVERHKAATIDERDARKTALAQVPGGKVQSHELERENGKLIYSYDIKVAGKPGVEEVNIDAITGAVVAHEHEDAKAEAKEKKAEARSQKKP